MITKESVKQLALDLGVDLCGIAPIERFNGAPRGFHPCDIFPNTKSVVVIAKCIPIGCYEALNPIPYTATNDIIIHEVIRITCELCTKLEKNANIIAVPIPSEPYECWDEERQIGKGILSLKHAGYAAGLGVLGKNTLLTNCMYGNRIILGAVLINIELEGDPIAEYQFCTESCQLCINACPVQAINEMNVNQKLCRSNSGRVTKKGYFLYVCNECRRICPNRFGLRAKNNTSD
jgi:epoxyqueuosine reductase QueG